MLGRCRPYASDITDARWALIDPVLAAWWAGRDARDPVGKRPRTELRRVWNAILYVNRTGCQWEYLPHDFPNWHTVASYCYAWRDEHIFEQVNAHLVALERDRRGRDAEPTAAVIDTQRVKTATTVPLNQQGPDPGKKVVGRKRGIVTDVLGLILAVVITAANVSDNAHAATLLTLAKTAHPSISAAFADQGFKDKAVERAVRAGIQLVVTGKPHRAETRLHPSSQALGRRTQLRHPHVQAQTRTRL